MKVRIPTSEYIANAYYDVELWELIISPLTIVFVLIYSTCVLPFIIFKHDTAREEG